MPSAEITATAAAAGGGGDIRVELASVADDLEAAAAGRGGALTTSLVVEARAVTATLEAALAAAERLNVLLVARVRICVGAVV